MKKSIIGFWLILITLITINLIDANSTHRCTWRDCKHYGQEKDMWKFVSQYDYPEHSREWNIEITHFMNPSWTKKECINYVNTGVE